MQQARGELYGFSILQLPVSVGCVGKTDDGMMTAIYNCLGLCLQNDFLV